MTRTRAKAEVAAGNGARNLVCSTGRDKRAGRRRDDAIALKLAGIVTVNGGNNTIDATGIGASVLHRGSE